MLVAEDRPVAVVVDLDELGAPPEELRKAGGEADADGGAQALRPSSDGAERGGAPVVGPDEGPELTAAGTPRTGTENYGGPLVTAGGLVFIAAAL